MTRREPRYDLVVVGGGIAGLFAALCAAGEGRVAVVSRGSPRATSSWHAQGGVAAAVGADDSPALHAEDTLRAGRGLSSPAATEVLTREAAARIVDLVDLGVEFDEGLGLEGGHSRRRIVHAGGGATGERIASVLAGRVLDHPGIDVLDRRVAGLWTESGRCVGVQTDSGTVAGRAIVLATGGMAALWERTTNPPGTVGEGVAMAYRAGAALADLEFVQFHPTVVAGNGLLLSEALRGEGALLLDGEGRRFTDELAPRDVVARANDDQIKRYGLDYVHLDISDRDPAFVAGHFPNIHEKLLTLGIDMTTGPIPVVPAQHYTCGGVLIDLAGRTDLPGLYAAGECTESGLHGANRLASNSLLECFVFGEAAARDIVARWDALDAPPAIRPWDESRVTDSDEEVVIKQNWTEIRRFMWNYVGIVRTTKRLERAQHRINMLTHEIEDYYGHFRVTTDLIELRNLLQCAELIVRSALHRKESRGLHYTLDYPDMLPEAVDTVLVP